jgi:hypothetical protein
MQPENEKGCQTSIKYVHQSTQTDFDLNSNLSNYKTSVSSTVSLVIIAQLLCSVCMRTGGIPFMKEFQV